MTYGFHLIFHEEHDGGICFGVALGFVQFLSRFYGQNIKKIIKMVQKHFLKLEISFKNGFQLEMRSLDFSSLKFNTEKILTLSLKLMIFRLSRTRGPVDSVFLQHA